MGSLSNTLKSSLSEMMFAVASRDINKLVSVIMSIGIKKGHVNRNKLFEDIDYLMDSYLSASLSSIKISSLLEDLLDTARQNNIRLPKDFTMLIRSLIIIEGVIVKLSPDIQIIDVVISYVKDNNKFSLKDIPLKEILIKGITFSKDYSRVPTKIIELSDSIMQGRAKIQLEHRNLNRNVNELNRMINRMIIGLVISSMIIGSSLVLNTNVGPKHAGISTIGLTGFAIAAFMGLLLLISIIRSGKI
jgi:ubiquinone biosynthesis protein